jgi:copper homeostasis protein
MTTDRTKILMEVCVESIADVTVAVANGANRVELCSSLELGGLTPSIGVAETLVATSPVPVVVMVRPRAGGFCYDCHEFGAMLRDAERFVDLGAAGVVFGVLDRSGAVDIARAREMVNAISPGDTVFHRAFDFVADWRKELDLLADIGCTRILTSGGRSTAASGIENIREMIEYAAGRLEILPGGGIRADNVVGIVQRTCCLQVHVGAAKAISDGSLSMLPDASNLSTNLIGASHRIVDGAAIAAISSALLRVKPHKQGT